MKRIVMFSGGIGSWATAKIVSQKFPEDELILLFSDVKGNAISPHIGEDEDTYRFIQEASQNVNGRLVIIKDGRDIWQVFKDRKFLGNSRQANCSTELKQKPARKWLETNIKPEEAIIYVGIDWSEIHRLSKIVKNYLPYIAESPLSEPPYYDKRQLLEWAKSEGLKPPRLYDLGFAHNNCGGGCVRAGQGQFKKLLESMPQRFSVWESKEQEFRKFIGKDVSILSETVNGVKKPLPLIELRRRVEANPALIDSFDLGGCGCFFEEESGQNGHQNDLT